VLISPTFYEQLLRQKITNPNLKAKKLHKKLSYEKAARKILVKLTPDQQLTFECNDKSVSADIRKTT
jgi:hypothetical protein